MKSRRKQSASNSSSATQKGSEPSETPIPPASVSASAISRLTEATIILALLTFAGYWYTFCYEVRFFSYFDIPYYFVSVTPTLILSKSILWVFLGATLGVVLLCIAIYIILGPVEQDMNARYLKLMKTVVVLIAIVSALFIIYSSITTITDPKLREEWTVHKLVTVVVSGLLCLFFVWVYQNYKKNIPWGFVGIALGITMYFVILGLGFRFLIAQGFEEAQKQEVFPVYVLPQRSPSEIAGKDDHSEVAIIRNYGDYLLAIPFTRITRKDNEDKTPAPFKKKLVIVKMPDAQNPLSLSFEKVGPLKAVDEVKPAEAKSAP